MQKLNTMAEKKLNCFIFMDHFLKVSFKYRKNPFEYDDTTKEKSSKLGSK